MDQPFDPSARLSSWFDETTNSIENWYDLDYDRSFFETFQDDFSSNNTNYWTGYTGTDITTSSGKLNLTPTTSYHFLNNKRTFTLTGSYVAFSIDQALVAGNNGQVFWGHATINPAGGAHARLEWSILGIAGVVTLQASYYNDSNTETLLASLTLNLANHKWLKLQEQNGTIYFRASPDGDVWTTIASVNASTFGYSLVNMCWVFGSGYSGTEPTIVPMIIDNFNLIPIYRTFQDSAQPVSGLGILSGDSLDFEGGTIGSFTPTVISFIDPVISNSTAQAQAGTHSLLAQWATSASSACGVWLPNLVPGGVYTVTGWVYVPTGSPSVSIDIFGIGLGTNTGATVNSWVQLTKTFTATSTAHFLDFQTTSTGAGQSAYIDSISVSCPSDTATEINTPGGTSWTVSQQDSALPSIIQLITGDTSNFEGGGVGSWAGIGTAAPTIASTTVQVDTGTKAGLLTWGAQTSFPALAFTLSGLSIGVSYTFVVRAHIPTGSVGIALSVSGIGFGGQSLSHNVWETITETFTASSTSHQLAITPLSGTTAGEVAYLDNITLTVTGATGSDSISNDRSLVFQDVTGTTDSEFELVSPVEQDVAVPTDALIFTVSSVDQDLANLSDYLAMLYGKSTQDLTGTTDGVIFDVSQIEQDLSGLIDTFSISLSVVVSDLGGLTDNSNPVNTPGGTAWTQTAQDQAGVTDSEFEDVSTVLSDSSAPTDSLALLQSVIKSDLTGTVDTLPQLEHTWGLVVSDTAGLIDTEFEDVASSLSDPAAPTDSLILSQSPIKSDAAVPTDTLITFVEHQPQISDVVGPTDSVIIDRIIVFQDQTGIVDTNNADNQEFRIDLANPTDAITTSQGYGVSQSDASGAVDQGILSGSYVKQDLLTLLDSNVLDRSLTNQDSSGSVDTFTTFIEHQPFAQDASGATDTQVIDQAYQKSDVTGTLDSFTLDHQIPSSYQDTSGSTDSVIISQASVDADVELLTDSYILSISPVVSDLTGSTDSIVTFIEHQPSASDPAGLVDSITLGISIVIQEQTGTVDTNNADNQEFRIDLSNPTDSISTAQGYSSSQSDISGLVDSLNIAQSPTKQDLAPITDSSALDRIIVTQDIAGATDSINTFIEHQPFIQDIVGPLDSSIFDQAYLKQDQSGTSDNVSITATGSNNVSDSISVTDSISIISSKVLIISDTTGSTDAVADSATKVLSDSSMGSYGSGSGSVAIRATQAGAPSLTQAGWSTAPVAGDLLLAFVRTHDINFNGTAVDVTATGWSVATSVFDAGINDVMTLLWKRALGTSADGGTFDDHNTLNSWYIEAYALSGADTTSPFDATISVSPSGSGTVITIGSLTIPTSTDFVIAAGSVSPTLSTTWTATAPLSLNAQWSDPGGTLTSGAVTSYLPGATGSTASLVLTASTAGSTRLGIAVAIKAGVSSSGSDAIISDRGLGVSDTSGVVDSNVILHTWGIVQSDTGGLTDSVLFTTLSVNSDTSGTTDSSILSQSPIKSDIAGTTDSLITFIEHQPLISDSAGPTDTILLDRVIVAQEQTGIVDTNNADNQEFRIDLANPTDSFFIGGQYANSYSDQAGLSDSFIIDQTYLKQDLQPITDSNIIDRASIVQDLSGSTDNVTTFLQHLPQNQDTAGLTDTFALQYSPFIQDATGSTDTNSISSSGATIYSDVSILTDSYAFTLSSVVQDLSGETDSVQLSQSLSRQDVTGPVDTTLIEITHSVSVSDISGPTDSASTIMSFTSLPQDVALVTDAIITSISSVISDQELITDSSSIARVSQNSDSELITDSYIREFGKSQSDPAGVTDSVSILFTGDLRPVDLAGLSDGIVISRTAIFVDNIAVNDTVITLVSNTSLHSDIVSVTDHVTVDHASVTEDEKSFVHDSEIVKEVMTTGEAVIQAGGFTDVGVSVWTSQDANISLIDDSSVIIETSGKDGVTF